MSFLTATRRKTIKLSTQSKGSINPITWDVPRAGILAGIYLYITATVSGTLSAPNALGAASIIKRVRLIANSGLDLINISGAGYHYLLRDHLEDYKDPVSFSTARSAVTATSFNLSMWLPVALNGRDFPGLFMLQNEGTLLQLSVEFETDSVVATGATVVASVTPLIEIFLVPAKREDWPPFQLAQTFIEDSRAISAAGDYEYSWPRGNHYLQVLHGLGIGASPTDNFTAARIRINKADYLEDWTPALLDVVFTRTHGRARLAGTIPVDLLGTTGLGAYGISRDVLNSATVTELDSVITAAAAGTLYTVRRQLVQLQAGG